MGDVNADDPTLGSQGDQSPDQEAKSVYKSWDYSVWAYDRGDGSVPILVVCFEWHIGEMHAMRSEGVWLHDEEDNTAEWSSYPEYNMLCQGIDSGVLAAQIAEGRLHRIGELPHIGRFAEPPPWLTDK